MRRRSKLMKARKLRNVLIYVIMFSLFVNIFMHTENIYGANKYSQVIYVDGIKFICSMDDSGTTVIKTAGKHAGSEIVINANGEARATVLSKGGKKEKYDLIINELSKKNVDVEVYTKSHKKVKEYKDIKMLYTDLYTGQAAIAIPVAILGTAIKALIVVAVSVVVAGVVYYAGAKAYAAIKSNKNRKKYYYRATLINGSVYVAYTSKLNKNQAASRIRQGLNIYTYTKGLARKAVIASGYRCSRREIDKRRKRGKIYFYHYHTSPKNGSHAWHGIPYTG